jgi:hypothetical protein
MSMVELCSVISVVAENSLNCCSMNIVNEDTTLSMTITQNVLMGNSMVELAKIKKQICEFWRKNQLL